MTEPIAQVVDVEDGADGVVARVAWTMPISRAMLLEHGRAVPTAEEYSDAVDERRAFDVDVRARWAALELPWRQWLDAAAASTVAAAVQRVHHPVASSRFSVEVLPGLWAGAECSGCTDGDGDHDYWPCETVTEVAAALGIALADVPFVPPLPFGPVRNPFPGPIRSLFPVLRTPHGFVDFTP